MSAPRLPILALAVGLAACSTSSPLPDEGRTATRHAPLGQGGGAACGSVTFEGDCQSTMVEWCEDGSLQQFDCALLGASCGLDAQSQLYDCLPGGGGGGAGATGADGAGSTNGAGGAGGNGAGGGGGAGSTSSGSNCGSVTEAGECQTDTLLYCDMGMLQTVDCAQMGLTCYDDGAFADCY